LERKDYAVVGVLLRVLVASLVLAEVSRRSQVAEERPSLSNQVLAVAVSNLQMHIRFSSELSHFLFINGSTNVMHIGNSWVVWAASEALICVDLVA
jgi:hypothetical protein